MKRLITFDWLHHHPKKTAAAIILFFTLISSTFSQLPPYYNFDQSIGANSFPFNVAVGKQVQWLILAGDLNQPAPAPSGTITKIYFRANSTGSPTFTNLTIKLGQASITTLPTGTLYTGPMDTVYYRASINISSTINTFFSLTLDRPYTYDNTKALIIDVQQCGMTGTGITVSQQTYTPFRRNYLSSSACPQVYNGQDGTCVGFGVDIAPGNPAITLCRNGINIAVPDNSANGARDTIKMIGNTNCSLLDVNVKIDTFAHTWISNMQFSLTHNGATNVNLFLNRGGSGDNIIGCTFNDSASQPISAGTPPFTGSWRPEEPLIAYNSQSPQGNWILFMVDQFAGDTGFLRAWCIQFKFTCPTGGIQTIEIPFTYKLSQNYPNPFNPVTTIKYGLPKYGITKLIVYDVLGRVAATLVDEFKDAGTYSINFDGTDLSSGIYFYTLESGSYKETKKMILMK